MLRGLGDFGEGEEVEVLLRVLRQTGPTPLALPQAQCGFLWQGVAFLKAAKLGMVREECMAASEVPLGVQDILLVTLYHASLLVRHHPRYIPRRRVCEAMVANTSPWILLALEANHELDIVVAI